MATVEVDEDELRQNHRLRTTLQAILAHPQAKLKVQEATRLVYPNAVTPELDQVKTQSEREAALEDKVNKLSKTIEDKEAERVNNERLASLTRNFESGFDKLRQERGYTDAGVEGIRKIMEEKGILDHEIAADHYDRKNPPQAPLTPNGRGAWNFMTPASDEDTDIKNLIASKGENAGLLDKMAIDALNDVRQQGRR